jgi:hypothetical protein
VRVLILVAAALCRRYTVASPDTCLPLDEGQVRILTVVLLLPFVSAQRPHTQPERLLPVRAWVPLDVSMGACPAFTHLHSLGTSIPDDPKYHGDGNCHSDDTDAPMLPKPAHDRVEVTPGRTKGIKPGLKILPPAIDEGTP